MKSQTLNHVGIIMDGNRRWAKARNLPAKEGHRAGVHALAAVTKKAAKLGIKFLTVYALSTENLKGRGSSEILGLLQIIQEGLKERLPELQKEGVKIEIIGDTRFLPGKIKESVEKAYSILQKNSTIQVNICLNYGSRAEIINATKEIITSKVSLGKIDEKLLQSFLYTKNIPDPELIIRTGGQKRLSNFLLWQAAYSELYFTDKLWPDFLEEDFLAAIEDYQLRKRNFGV